MKKGLIALLALTTLCCGLLFIGDDNKEDKPQYTAPGMVAYAASYSDDYENEPKYSTEKTKTFDYLNLGNALDYYRGDSVKVGIIDSGINYDHEDFMVNNTTKVKGDSKYYSYNSDDKKWYYYDASTRGYSYIDDTLGHGSNVAATVAAAINGIGGLGLAPNVELYVYKVTNSSNGYEFGAIQNALMDAKTLGLDVVNMSFQSYEHAVSYNGSSMAASSGCSTIMSYYINQAYNAGITLVGAAGNFNTDEPSYPGSNNHVINVGSLNETGTGKAGFSNYGSTIDLVAPGYVHVADKGTNSSYKNTSGTSFSAPLVTAAIALYKQKNPSATPAQIESALYASCDSIDSGTTYSNWAGNGSLNVLKFLGLADNTPTEIIINNPEVVDEELMLNKHDTFDLDWTVNGNGTFDHSVNFYTLSGDDDVISVDQNGRITANGDGSDYVIIESNADSGVYASIYVTVTTVKTLTSISISGYNTNFVEGDTFSFGGTVTAHFSDSSSSDVTSNSTFTGYTMTSVSQQTVTVSYTIDNITKTTSYTINVGAGTPSFLSISGQTTIYTKNAAYAFDGTCTVTFTNGYQKVVTPTSVSSPDMSTAGNKTVIVSYIYNNKTVSTTYNIIVNFYRDVFEETDSVIGTITYPNDTQTISSSTLSISTGGYTAIESNSIRLGSGSNTGTLTVTSSTTNIYKVVVSAKSYGSDSSVTLTIGGTSNTITSSYANYTKEYTSAVKSIAIATTASKKRAYVQSVTAYTKANTNIGQTEDCIGLETFINTFMHMDYVDNLGYCNDQEHHYYSTAKAAFNQLNTHQRSLFVGNSAYSNEYNRLAKWAEFNGDNLNTNTNKFEKTETLRLNNSTDVVPLIIVISSLVLTIVISGYVILKRRKVID